MEGIQSEQSSMIYIASNWKALSGIDGNWEKLKSDPIDNNLRRYLIHYAERVGAVADSFNHLEETDRFGLPLFPPETFFSQTGLEIGNPFKYQVTDLIYARSGFDVHPFLKARVSEYMGYVAVATDHGKRVLGRRDILICWRGTAVEEEWYENIDFKQVRADKVFNNSVAKVHHGFLDIYTSKTKTDAMIDFGPDSNKQYTRNSAREQVLEAVRKHVDYYGKLNETVSITVAGHSLGGALGTLNAMDIVSNGYNKPTGSNSVFPVTAFLYASPRVGNEDFLELFNSLPDLYLLRIRNATDMIPILPPDVKPVFNISYCDVGAELDIEINNSEELIDNCWVHYMKAHNLNVHMYGIASYQGKGKDSKLAIKFDVSLLNKNDNLLKDNFKVPIEWWSSVMKNGMAQMDDGFWKLYNPPLPPNVPDFP